MPNQSIFNGAIKLQLNINRVAAGLQKKAAKILDNLSREISAKLSGKPLTEYSRKRLKALQEQADESVKVFYSQIHDESTPVMEDIAKVTGEHTGKAIAAIAPPSLGVTLAPAKYLDALAGDAIIQGATQREWWDKQAKDVQWKFKTQLQQGLVAGETNQQILYRLVGKRGVPGVLDMSRREASTLIHTSAQTVANDARLAVYDDNDDIIRRLRWVSTLDGRVCLLCAARADKKWDIKTHAPIGHGIPFKNPPIHFRDRCVLVGETATFAELGFDLQEPPEGQRASIVGPVPANTTFENFLKKHKGFAEESLGPGRADLFLKGKITLEDLINGNGRPLTIAQLKKTL